MIVFKDVNKSYKNTTVLKDISFTIEDGDLVCLIGESGCGKTTTLKMINKLWVGLIVLGSLCLLVTGKSDVLNEQILSSGKATLELVMQIFPLMSLWLGIMNIARESGLLFKVSKFISPLLHKIFPEIPKNHEAFGFISSNILSNMFGLGNAATPFGLKAMESLQKLNNNKEDIKKYIINKYKNIVD